MTHSSVFGKGNRRKGILRKGILLISAVVTVVLLGEGMARLFHDPTPLRRVYDPFAYRIPQPNLVDSFSSMDGEKITVRLNELGMRGPGLAEPAPPDAVTMVFLGGSTTENYAYRSADTFPEMVGQRIRESLGRPVRVFNAGMSAATTGTSLARLQHQILSLEPDIVIVMHAVNDLVMGFHPGFRSDGRHLPRPRGIDWRPASYLVDWLLSLRGPPRGQPARKAGEMLQKTDYRDFTALHVFKRNLRSMSAIAEAHGISILFLTQGTMYRNGWDEKEGSEKKRSEKKRDENVAGRFMMTRSLVERGITPPDFPSLARGMDAFNGVVLAMEMSEKVHVFDLCSGLPKTWEVFYDDCHLTREGNRLAAEALAPVIEGILR